METRLTTVGMTRFLTNPRDIFVGKSLEVYGEWSYGELILIAQLLERTVRLSRSERILARIPFFWLAMFAQRELYTHLNRDV